MIYVKSKILMFGGKILVCGSLVASGNISILIGQEMSDEGIICVKVVIDC
jgi:hypothetical protein